MDTRRALLVDAFTSEPLAGNAAGVIPDAGGLSDGQMQAIARELHAADTAFIADGVEWRAEAGTTDSNLESGFNV